MVHCTNVTTSVIRETNRARQAMENSSSLVLALQASIFLLSTLYVCKGNEHEEKHETVLLISIDGLGWRFVGSNLTHTPNFDFIASTGVKAKNMLPVYPTKTFPIHTTFLTGLYPESHGIVDNKFWDPVYQETFILETDCSNFDPKFYNDSEPIWVTMQKRGERTAAYFWPGSTSYVEKPAYYANHICYFNCNYYSGKRLENLRRYTTRHCIFDWGADPFTNRVDKVLEWLKSAEPPRLVLLYFEQPDGKGHYNGPNSYQYRQMIEKIDGDVIGRLLHGLTDAQLLDKVNVVIVSDHGMIETSYLRQIRLNDYTHTRKYFTKRASDDQIWPKPGWYDDIYKALKNANNSHLKVYKKEEIPEELHWKNNRRIPPIYLVTEEGWLMRADYDAESEGQWTEGNHVWPPSQNSAAIFYARGPAFKEGYYSPRSLRAVDVYSLLCHILGIEPLANNGSLGNMMEFLKEKPAVMSPNVTKDINPSLVSRYVSQGAASRASDHHGGDVVIATTITRAKAKLIESVNLTDSTIEADIDAKGVTSSFESRNENDNTRRENAVTRAAVIAVSERSTMSQVSCHTNDLATKITPALVNPIVSFHLVKEASEGHISVARFAQSPESLEAGSRSESSKYEGLETVPPVVGVQTVTSHATADQGWYIYQTDVVSTTLSLVNPIVWLNLEKTGSKADTIENVVKPSVESQNGSQTTGSVNDTTGATPPIPREPPITSRESVTGTTVVDATGRYVTQGVERSTIHLSMAEKRSVGCTNNTASYITIAMLLIASYVIKQVNNG